MGGAIDPQRSTWSRSTWSSAGEDASAEAAQYVELAEEAAETGSLDAPIPHGRRSPRRRSGDGPVIRTPNRASWGRKQRP